MDYIILDLEWNQSPTGKEHENKDIPFEIIEIGAVKVDENNNIVSEFHEYVKPVIYNELHPITKELLRIDWNKLKMADSFGLVIERLKNWCGTSYWFGTWGPMDLVELQRNLNYYNINDFIVGPIKYYDIQKLFSIQFEGYRISRTLEYAVDFLKIEKDSTFHSAIHDARYTALIYTKITPETKKNYSIDCFNNPKNIEDQIYVTYENYSKFVSREFPTREVLLGDKEINKVICNKCGRITTKKIKWFTSNSKNYYCVSYCKKHGYLRGKISIKKTRSQKYYCIKTIKQISKEEVLNISYKKEQVRIKRKEKRLKKK